MPEEAFVPEPLYGEAPTAPEAAPAPSLGIGTRIADAVDSVNSGIGSAFHETGVAAVDLVGSALAPGQALANKLMGTDYKLAEEGSQAYKEWDKGVRAGDGSNYTPKTLIGGGAQGISQFLTGFIFAGKALKAVSGAGGVARGFVAGAVADATVFDPHADRLSNLFNTFAETHPSLRNPLTDYLAAEGDDSDIEGRLKNAMEGVVIGGAIEQAMKGFRALRNVWRAKVSGGTQAGEAAWAKAADELEADAKAGQMDQTPPQKAEGTQGMGQEPIVAPTEAGPAPKAIPEGGAPKVEPVAPEAPKAEGAPEAPKAPEGELKPDDAVSYDHNKQMAKKVDAQNRAVKAIEEPFFDGPELDHLTEQLKNNPDWRVPGGFRPNERYNYTRLDTEDGAKLALDEVAKLVQPSLKGRDFKSFETILKDSARMFGEQPEALLVNLQGLYKSTKDIEASLVAGRSLVTGLAKKAADLARKVEADPGLQGELDKVLQQTANVDRLVRGIRSNTARATTAGRIRTAAELTPPELKALQGASPEEFMKIVEKPPLWVKLMNAHNQYWINSLLSGATTHIRNVVSNTINTVALPLERMVGGALLRDMDAIKAGAGLYMGLRSAVRDSFRLAVKASGLPDVAKSLKNGEVLDSLKSTGQSILDPGNEKLASGVNRTVALSTDNFESLKGSFAGTSLDYFGQAVNVPSRFLTAEDEFFKQINYRAQVHADAYTDGLKSGLKGEDLDGYIKSRVEDSMTDAGAAKNAKALEYAHRATFTTKPQPGTWMADLEAFSIKHPATKLVLPFIRTPTNILGQAALRTPGLNLLSKRYRSALAGELGNEAKADAVGKMATGGALWASAIMLALDGKVTGKGPADPRERQLLINTGWQPYSFKTSSGYVSFQGFDPMSMFFGLAGDYADSRAHMNGDHGSAIDGSMLIAMANNVTSKTYLTGLSQVMSALTDPSRDGEAFIKSRAASYVPSGFKQLAGLIPSLEDPYLREARTVMDSIQNKLPGFSQSLPPKRNIFGDAVTARQALGPDTISPFYYSEQKDDKAANELARFARVISAPAQKVGNIDLTQFKNAKGQDFYDRMQEQLSVIRYGRYTLKERLEHLVDSPAYAKWRSNEPDQIAVGANPRTLNEVRAIIVEFRDEAMRKTLKEYPEVDQMVRAQKKAGVRAETGTPIPEALQQILNINK